MTPARRARIALLAVVALHASTGQATAQILPTPVQGPFTHKVFLASSPDGIDWSRSGAPLLEHASVPDVIVTPKGRLRIYYVDASVAGAPSSVNCANLVKGRTVVLGCTIAGQPTPTAVDPSIVRLPDGRYRLYYFAATEGDIGGLGPHTIRRAISRDGVHFRDEGVAFQYPGLVDPDVFWTGKRWLMFVFSLTDGKTVVATSRGGRSFTYIGPLSLQGFGTTGPLMLGRKRFRLYAFPQGPLGQRTFASFLSSNALSWTQEPGTRLTALPGEEITDPQVVRFKGGWRMVFKTSPAP